MAQNLISKVDGVTLKYTPSEFTYGLQDVSDTQSGRTLDAVMHKNRIAQKRKLNMAIQMRRGNESDFDASKMQPGEFAVSTDQKKVRIAFASGDVKELATTDSIPEISE